jgi:hypothetical protein
MQCCAIRKEDYLQKSLFSSSKRDDFKKRMVENFGEEVAKKEILALEIFYHQNMTPGDGNIATLKFSHAGKMFKMDFFVFADKHEYFYQLDEIESTDW